MAHGRHNESYANDLFNIKFSENKSWYIVITTEGYFGNRKPKIGNLRIPVYP